MPAAHRVGCLPTGRPEEKGRGRPRRRTDRLGRRLSQPAGRRRPTAGGLAPATLMPEEPRNWKSHWIGCSRSGGGLGEGPGKASGSGVPGKREAGGGSWSSPRGEREGRVLPKLWRGGPKRTGLTAQRRCNPPAGACRAPRPPARGGRSPRSPGPGSRRGWSLESPLQEVRTPSGSAGGRREE